ncbi:decarboxylating NADP(+)-dependent phosphogluconate dehydrogenase [Candidatus Methylacidithermus pantelleriae]|uniref:6-phosphogluconate dehydrogenase, decarboxylating n=1 Tax=Candidatus Methylacidithermus pantelleriae TaxID=2744239 RepID=A0A8J2BLK3_9BACT|nr:decarboxylating NADP(+)-dependent phosphogluconate dehydrogenase [Candidatus Methylacidithermus pantelleriae]CAF0696389.1 6-phosphogluconate dehydrogenase, decarboxylating [Candidatus Methylacidithermus pantelleriae]
MKKRSSQSRCQDSSCDVGLVGLGVMGQNLALNFEEHGYSVAVYNRTWSRTEEFLAKVGPDKRLCSARKPAELATLLKRPRKILLMVQAGPAVDEVIKDVLPVLEPGDILIDGGNSHYKDTERRLEEVASRGILFVGMGVSGGEAGARSGPSLMPGGRKEAWPEIQPMLQAISAKAADGLPCCEWMGSRGAGHFVKMVHNAIEYADMECIAEAYHFFVVGCGIGPREVGEILEEWNRGDLESYLIEITRDIMTVQAADGTPLVHRILDVVPQKGTGRWAVEAALELGVPLPVVAEACFARDLSQWKEERMRASRVLLGPQGILEVGCLEAGIVHWEKALYVGRIVAHAQGFRLLIEASRRYGWELDCAKVAQVWRAGCIIRSAVMERVRSAFLRNPALESLLLDEYFRRELGRHEEGLREAVATSIRLGVPVPGLSSVLAFYDGYRSSKLPANVIAAQRDYFGAHGYARQDLAPQEIFHTDWATEARKAKEKMRNRSR